jgi:hypothetical protein
MIFPAVLLALGLLIRVWGIDFAPTSPRARPDEDIFIQNALSMPAWMKLGADEPGLDRPGLDILRSGWPEGFFRLHYYLIRLEQFVLDLLAGRKINMACLYALNPGAVELPGRLFSALCDLLTCLLVGVTVRTLAPRNLRRAGWWMGALAYSFNYLAVRDAHFGVSDATLVFLFTLSLYFAVRAVLEDSRFLPAAGAAAGVAFGVKYSAVALLLPCLIAWLGALSRSPGRRRTLVLGAASFGVALAALALTSPTIFWHPTELLGSLMVHRFRYDRTALDLSMDQNWEPVSWWKFYLLEDLPAAFGVPGLILAVLGLGLLVAQIPWAGVVLISSGLATFSTLFGLQMLFTRYGAPLIPPLAIALGYLLVATLGLLLQRLPRAAAAVAFGGPLALAVGPPLWTSLQFDRLLACPSTYDIATRWLVRQGASKRTVAQGWYAQVQLLDPE